MLEYTIVQGLVDGQVLVVVVVLGLNIGKTIAVLGLDLFVGVVGKM